MNLQEIAVDKGVYFTNNNYDTIPPGFLDKAHNMTPSDLGELWPRAALNDTQYHSSTASSTFGTYGSGMTNFNMLQLGEGSLAAGIWFNHQNGASGVMAAINKVGGASFNVVNFAFNYGAPSFCEYNNIIYASTTASGVRKIRASNFATSAITEALVAGSPNLDGIISFKNRLFGWGFAQKNRIYYTDVPGPGLLPETWNTAVNFFDVPGFRGTPTIYSLLTIENRIFIFTDSGLYTVLISGPPSTWVLRTLDDTIRVDNRYAAFVFRNILYFVDDVSIWASDGSDFKNIGESIAPYIRNFFAQGAAPLIRKRLFLFGNMLIFTMRQNIGGTHTGQCWSCEMDIFKWSNFMMNSGGNDNSLTEVHGVFNNLRNRQYPGQQNYIMTSHIQAGSLEKAQLATIAARPGLVASDSTFGIQCQIRSYFKTRPLDFDLPGSLKQVNWAEVDMLYFDDPTTLTCAWWVDGFQVQKSVVLSVPLGIPNGMRVRIEGPGMPFRLLAFEMAVFRPIVMKKLFFDLEKRGMIDEPVYATRV